jgi:hypothetical protein
MIKVPLIATVLIFCALTTFAQTPDANGILFVKKGALGNGNSWANATGELADALLTARILNSANPGHVKQIWVAGGTYYPLYAGDFNSVDPRDRTFLLVKDVQLYGGFAGTENLLSDRNLSLTTNATILSGDIGTLAIYEDNAHHVLIACLDVGTAALNGFTVVKGNANSNDHSSLWINSTPIQKNSGAGIFCYTASPTIVNCIFAANKAVVGAGMYFGYQSNPTVTNTIISGNVAGAVGRFGNGAGLFFYRSTGTYTNMVVSGNYAFDGGAAIGISSTSVPVINNSIVQGNNLGIYNYHLSPYTLKNSLVQGIAENIADGVLDGNLVGPMFVNAPDASTAPFIGGDYRLSANSACVNTGSNVLFTGLDANSTDIEGKGRVFLYGNGGVIDMGAYEFGSHVLPVRFGVFRAKQQGMAVDLKWHTYTERDHSHFLISRSANGIDYSVLGKINGEGNTSTVQNYSFRDGTPLRGTNYYRLTQVDQNGTTVVLAETVLNFEWADVAVSAYPIPTIDKLYVSFVSGRYKKLTLIDLNGKVLIQQNITAQQNILALSLAAYAPGIYLLSLNNVHEKMYVKVVKE